MIPINALSPNLETNLETHQRSLQTVTGDFSGHGEHLASNIAGVCAWLLFARWLFVKGFFIVL